MLHNLFISYTNENLIDHAFDDNWQDGTIIISTATTQVTSWHSFATDVWLCGSLMYGSIWWLLVEFSKRQLKHKGNLDWWWGSPYDVNYIEAVVAFIACAYLTWPSYIWDLWFMIIPTSIPIEIDYFTLNLNTKYCDVILDYLLILK